MNKKILIIVAHTDDETLGCGSAIQWHNKQKDKVFAISFTNGLSSRININKSSIKSRLLASTQVSKYLKFNWVERYTFPDNELDKISTLEIAKIIENIKKKIKPNIIYTHHYSDLNVDHQKIFNATIAAFRPLKESKFEEIRLMEVPSATDYGQKKNQSNFVPNVFLDSKKFYKKKIKALKFYKNEIKKYPNSRSIQGIINLMKYRGNQVGLGYAEAFEIFKKIIRK